MSLPRVTMADIEAAIVNCEFQKFGETMTVCVLTLKNGFMVTGESACAHPGLYDQAIGENIARNKAVEKIWPLLGYALRDRLYIAGEETWLERLRRERDELGQRILKLDGFTNTDTFKELPDLERKDLMTQRALMSAYLEILTNRTKRAENQKTD